MHFWNGKEYTLLENEFGSRHLNPLPPANIVSDYYKNSYFQNSHSVYRSEYSEPELQQIANESKLRARMLVENNILNPSNFLDVGCGEGWYMDYWQKMGATVCGIDFTNFGVKTHNSHLAQFVEQGDLLPVLTNGLRDHEEFDLVYLGNVLEHVPNPREIIKQSKKRLSREGVLQVRVPNDFSDLQKDLLDKEFVSSEYWVAIPDHMNYFNLQNLIALVEDEGLLVIDAIASFPIDWFLANSSSNYINNPEKGPSANQARLEVENLISEKNDESTIYNFYKSLAQIGHGRNITILCKTQD